jgi:hypothetical protein
MSKVLAILGVKEQVGQDEERSRQGGADRAGLTEDAVLI